MNEEFMVWYDLVYNRLDSLRSDVRVSVQLFVNSRSYKFEKYEAINIVKNIEEQLDFVRKSYMQGTPAGIKRASFEPLNDVDTLLSKQQQSFRRLARRRIGIRLLPHIASVGTASRRTSYTYPYELGMAASDAVNEIVEPLLIVIKKSIEEDYVLSDFDKECKNFFNE